MLSESIHGTPKPSNGEIQYRWCILVLSIKSMLNTKFREENEHWQKSLNLPEKSMKVFLYFCTGNVPAKKQEILPQQEYSHAWKLHHKNPYKSNNQKWLVVFCKLSLKWSSGTDYQFRYRYAKVPLKLWYFRPMTKFHSIQTQVKWVLKISFFIIILNKCHSSIK